MRNRRRVVHAADSQRLALQDRLRDLLVRAGNDVAERLAGNPHPLRGLGLVEALDVGQAHRLDLIQSQFDLLKRTQRGFLRLEIARRHVARDAAALERSDHGSDIVSSYNKPAIIAHLLAYAHKLTIRVNWYDAAMVVTNSQHETAIVVRRDGQTVVFIRLKAGRLACERITETMFRESWREGLYPLPETIERFLEHGRIHGATQEASRGLARLQERDRVVVASLF